ncbi:MAG: ABC transporter permease [Spirochaetales bacterium]|nr:ABC transporter permease [Spirochaetales bacterium]
MKVKNALFLAFKFFSSKNTDKNLFRHIRGAVIGIALSLVPLVIVLEVTDGMIEGITRRYIEVGSYHYQARDLQNSEADYKAVIKNLESLETVDNAFAFIQDTCLIYTKKGRTGVSVRGLPENLYDNDRGLKEYLVFSEGSFTLDSEAILLSSSIAKKIGASTGDEIKLLTAFNQPGRALVLRPARFIVKGVFTTGYRELDEVSVYINYDRASSLFRGASQPYIGIKVKNPYNSSDSYKDKTAEELRNYLPPAFILSSWYRLNYTLYKSLETTKKLLMLIMILILCVASLNISSAMIMMVLSRRKEIAILKSIGFSQNDIALAFLATGVLIGLAGTFIGMLAGIAGSLHINWIIGTIEKLINYFIFSGYFVLNLFRQTEYGGFRILDSGYYLEQIPVTLDFFELCLVSFISLFLSSAASFLPSFRAGAIRPVEILRKS